MMEDRPPASLSKPTAGQPIGTSPASAFLVGGRLWRGPSGPSPAGRPTRTSQERDDLRRLARSLAVCTAAEALAHVADQSGSDNWLFSIARRSTEDQIFSWLKGDGLTDPSQETSPVLWVVGTYAAQPLTHAQFMGWMFPSMEPASAGDSSGVQATVFVFTEDRSPVSATEPIIVERQTNLHPNEPCSQEDGITALQRIAELPEVPSQMESFPDLGGFCSMPRE
jgi:hypothetical protein